MQIRSHREYKATEFFFLHKYIASSVLNIDNKYESLGIIRPWVEEDLR